MLELLYLAGEEEGADPFPERLLEQLRRLIRCDVVSYGDFAPEGRTWRIGIRIAGEPHAPFTSAITEAQLRLHEQIPFRPCSARAHTPFRWSDLISRRELHRLELYWEVDRPAGTEHQLWLWLHAGDEVLGALAFDRFARDFSDRDVLVLQMLRPHLARLVRRAQAPLRLPMHELTARESEILGWLARGKSNREIASLLFIAPGTVRKHLYNIYGKLDVPNRTAAVSRAYGLSRDASSQLAAPPPATRPRTD